MKAATITPYAAGIVTCISIHAAREGGDIIRRCGLKKRGISIHAAREGGDVCVRMVSLDKLISIHAAREGGDIQP